MRRKGFDQIQEIEDESGQRVNTVLQLRIHPALLALRDNIQSQQASWNGKRHSVRLTYITSRGTWYRYSWKGDEAKSGGIATNIEIHFFGLSIWLFGGVEESQVHIRETEHMASFMALENADVDGTYPTCRAGRRRTVNPPLDHGRLRGD